MAGRLGVSDRLTLDLRFLDDEEIADLVNGATACAYIPIDEDALGYVAMEAAQASKPIISCTDSGGVLGIARDGITGWVCAPDAAQLGEAMSRAIADPRASSRLGNGARSLLDSLDLTWETTIERLTS